jgi:hypothetical protein
MKSTVLNILSALLVMLLLPGCKREVAIIKKWQPADFVYKTDFGSRNPFDITVTALVTKPDGTTLKIGGFYNGDNAWVIRLSADMEGEWQFVTQSDEKSLNGKNKNFTCVKNDNPKIHGKLEVNKEDKHHFTFQDGSFPFILGYESDFIWSLDQGQGNIDRTEQFLDKISGSGFNYIVMNAFAYDTQWCKGHSGEFDFGPPAMIPWEGDITTTDYTRFNISYWKHYDKVVDAMYKRGIIAHIMFKVYNKAVKWPAAGSADDDRYFKWIVNRYSAYPNIVWDYAKESYYEKDIDYKKNRLELIRTTDAYHHVVTIHDDNDYYKGYYDSLADFHADQFHGDNRYEKSLEQRAYKKWPVMNIEFGYECGPGGISDKTYNQVQEPEEVCNRAWVLAMAGSYIVYYYTNTAWDVINYDETPVGYQYFKIFSDFFSSIGYNTLTPFISQIDKDSGGYSMVKNGQELLFYRFSAEPFILKTITPTQNFEAYWLHPYTGEKRKITTIINQMAVPPADWVGNPVVLYISEL